MAMVADASIYLPVLYIHIILLWHPETGSFLGPIS